MNLERLKITGEVYATRAKANLRLVLQLAGVVLVLLAAYNMLLAPVLGMQIFAPYRAAIILTPDSGTGAFYLADVVAMAFGAVLAWFL